MINVRVREDNGVNLMHVERNLPVFYLGFSAPTLKEPKVEHDGGAIDANEMT